MLPERLGAGFRPSRVAPCGMQAAKVSIAPEPGRPRAVPRTWERWVPLSGVIAAVLILVGGSPASGGPDVDAAASEISEWYVDNDTTILAGTYLVWLGALLVLPFQLLGGASVSVRIEVTGSQQPSSAAESRRPRCYWSAAFSTGSRPAGPIGTSRLTRRSPSRSTQSHGISSSSPRLRLRFCSAQQPSRSTRMLPGWLSWTAAILAVASLVSWVVWIAFWLDLLWMGAAGVVLVLRHVLPRRTDEHLSLDARVRRAFDDARATVGNG